MSRKKSAAELAALIAGREGAEDGPPLPTFTVGPEDIEEDMTPAIRDGRPGRPSKYTLVTVAGILNGIVHAMSYKGAANLAGISEDQFHEWMNTKPDFAALVEQANAMLEAWIMDSVMRQVANNWAAGITILERRDPARWGRRDRVEHTHTGTVGLNIQQVLSSPAAIQAASALEAALQAGEVIEGQFRELPAHQEDGA